MNKQKTAATNLPLAELLPAVRSRLPVVLSAAEREQVAAGRAFLDEKLKDTERLYYGINTGFGALCNIRINADERQQLQENLVKSHACGTGDEVPDDLVRLMLLLKVRGLALGYSGVRVELVERLIDMYNADLLPVIYQQGSLGASGDLAPLAHLSLPLLGLGEVRWRDRRMSAADALRELGWQPLELRAKEGLALLNGTQFSAAYACWAYDQARQLLDHADRCAALSLDAFAGDLTPFRPEIHALRPHPGQVQVAAAVRALLAESPLARQPKGQVQDPYAFRCVPQVHGASRDALAYLERVLIIEIDSVTDNPSIIPEADGILSGGNFHAQPLALALDFLAIALAEIGSISERRVYQLLSGQRGLPVFLARRPGLHSGLMIVQYTAASIVSQNKQYATPASVDSIVSSNGQEDHVSMAANAATKLARVVENVWTLLAIEWLVAAEAMEYRRPGRTAPELEALLEDFREQVPALETDRPLSGDIRRTKDFLYSLKSLQDMGS